MKKLILIILIAFASIGCRSQGNFFWSYNNIGGYGLLYNWFTTQPQLATIEYGYLYNWYAATDTRNIAPAGFHVPTNTEFETAMLSLDPSGTPASNIAGGKMKTSGLEFWNTPNTSADNSSGFNCVGSGYKSQLGVFVGLKNLGRFWNKNEQYSQTAFMSYCSYNNGIFNTSNYFIGYTTYKQVGNSLRFVADSGTPTIATGNDGKVYPCITIGGQTWTAVNSMETKYRDGSAIPEVTNNTAWTAATTGMRCSYNNTESNAGTTKSIAPVGWHVPTYAEYVTLTTYLGGATVSGGKLKKTGLLYWLTPNTGADNSSGFNGRGSGNRNYLTGVFQNFKNTLIAWVIYNPDPTISFASALASSNSAISTVSTSAKTYGQSLRLIKNDSTDPGTVTDADGNVYQTVKIGTQVWIASNWKCTKWNDGSPITYIESNAAWAAATEAAWCNVNGQSKNK